MLQTSSISRIQVDLFLFDAHCTFAIAGEKKWENKFMIFKYDFLYSLGCFFSLWLKSAELKLCDV